MIAEWASIYIIYDASITLFEKAWTWHEVPVPNHLMETESEFAPWDLSKAHILVSTPVAPCFCSLNNGTLASGKTRMVPITSKCTTAWFLASNSKSMPLAMKWKEPDLPQHITESPWENWWIPTTWQLHRFCTAQCPSRAILDPATSSW